MSFLANHHLDVQRVTIFFYKFKPARPFLLVTKVLTPAGQNECTSCCNFVTKIAGSTPELIIVRSTIGLRVPKLRAVFE